MITKNQEKHNEKKQTMENNKTTPGKFIMTI